MPTSNDNPYDRHGRQLLARLRQGFLDDPQQIEPKTAARRLAGLDQLIEGELAADIELAEPPSDGNFRDDAPLTAYSFNK